MAARSQQQRRDVWRNAERHYCSVCNVWMGGDRQSISLHENGRKHKENVERVFEQKRQDKLRQEQAQRLLQSSLAQVERAAARAHALDPTFAGDELAVSATTTTTTSTTTAGVPTPDSSQPPNVKDDQDNIDSGSKQDKQAWESRKKQRQAASKRHNEDYDEEQEEQWTTKKARRTVRLSPDEGHYELEGTTYLEGSTFASLLESEMPIQIWTGSGFANLAEKRLPEKHHYWKNGLVLAVRRRMRPKTDQHERQEQPHKSSSSSSSDDVVLDVAYLMQPTDEEETLEKSVNPARIRLVLGGDESIPDTLEEARLMVMGEEVTQVQETVQLDENTGLSTWGTVSIRKTTARSELKEERDRIRAKKRQQTEKEEEARKAMEARRMEEAKVENAHDSALGAYDVWNSGKAGYKGVDINNESRLDVQDTVKSLSKGMGPIGFKKKDGAAFKKAKKKQNRRTTSADD